MSQILTTLRLPEPALEILRQAGTVTGPERWEEGLADAEALVAVLTVRVDRALLERAPRLRVVANVAVGYDNVDVAACRERGVVVTNTPDVLTEATADLALALILAVVRGLRPAEASLRAGEFRQWRFWDYLAGDVSGATLGILGMGRIGREVARRAAAFRMEILYHSRTPLLPEEERALGARWVGWDELLRASDILSLHAPLTPETRHLMNGDTLRRMKPGSYLINTARGPLVDEAALVEVLREGHLAGVGLDVHEHEPRVTPGLLEFSNVVLLPHVGSATPRTRIGMATLAARNARAVLLGEAPLTPV